MEAPTWAFYAILSLITITLLLLSNHLLGRGRKPNRPPGPKPWPIIGNLDLIGPLPHHSLHELSKKYGPIMMLQYGSVPVLVGSSLEMAKLFLNIHDRVFAGRPMLAAGKYTTQEYSGILWSQYGPYFSKVRKICLMELFSPKRLESFKYIRVEEMNSFLKEIYSLSLDVKPILLKDYITNLNFNIMSRMILGKDYMNNKEENSNFRIGEFKDMIDEFMLINGVFNLGDWIPIFKYFDVQGYVKRMKALGKKFDGFMEHVLDEHTTRMDREKENWMAKDMVDILLQLSNNPKSKINFGINFERKAIKGISQDLIVGGTDTSQTILEWIMAELLRHPTVINKATQELDDVVGRNRWVEENDLQNLPYIRAIVKEAMRLHQLAPMLQNLPYIRAIVKDVQIEGYHIPKGSVVIVNTFTIHRDSSIYERPEEFRPERFIEKDIDVKGKHFELLPFGSGRRMCPAYNHGLMVVESTLAYLLQGFVWKLPNNMKPEDLDMEEKYGLVVSKKNPLVIYVEPRLAPCVYDVL